MSDVPGRAMRLTVEGAPGVGKTLLLDKIMRGLASQYTFVADPDNEHAILLTKIQVEAK